MTYATWKSFKRWTLMMLGFVAIGCTLFGIMIGIGLVKNGIYP